MRYNSITYQFIKLILIKRPALTVAEASGLVKGIRTTLKGLI